MFFLLTFMEVGHSETDHRQTIGRTSVEKGERMPPHNACRAKGGNKGIGGPAGTAKLPQKACEKRASRNSPSFAVALNWGIGSSSLNAEVKAFERLQIVRDRNSSYCGSK